MDKFEVIIVGGGLAGLSAAYTLAKDGFEVLVIERGDYCGAKNVTGGRLYLNPVRKLLPDIWDEAPLERCITSEKIVLMAEHASTSIELKANSFSQKPAQSYSVLRAKFDQWLAEKVTSAGAVIVTKMKVDDLIIEDGKVTGIIAGEDKIGANVVIAADGVMSRMAIKAGLKENHKSQDYAVGIKEIIELPEETISERFNLSKGEGTAQLFMGAISRGMMGGGFLYTNISSISLGLVIKIDSLVKKNPPLDAPVLFEEFKRRPELANLLAKGETVEYSAHVIPESGINAVPQLYGDGILVTGDAAGLTLNTGLTVRGMDFAIASGVYAAATIKNAKVRNDYSRKSLAEYASLLRNSFVLKDLETFNKLPHFMDNPRLFTVYPELVSNLMEQLMFTGDVPKEKMSSTVLRQVKKVGPAAMLKDMFGAFGI